MSAAGTHLVTAFTPNRRSGTGLRTCGVVQALAANGPVEVHYVDFGGSPLAEDLAELPAVRLHRVTPGRGGGRILAVAHALAHGVPPVLARAASAELAAAAAAAPAGARVVADGPNVAGALLGLAARRPVTYLAHNLESAFRGTPRLEHFERRVLQRFAASWMATRADVAGARALAGDGPPLLYVPNVVDTARTPTVPRDPAGRVLFVADFRYPPNADALAFLLDDVLPRVWSALPEARVTLVGRGLEQPPADARVEAMGFVEDLEAQYARASVVAVPLRVGGGSPLKFIEALAHGLPVVATGHAAALLEDGRAGEHFLAADDPAGFADHLVAVLRGGHREIDAAGRELARGSYSVEALAGLLAAA